MMGTCRLPSEIQQPIKIKLVQVCTKVQTLGSALSQRGDSPFVYRDGTGWPASLPYIWKIRVSVAIGTQSGIHLHERVPMVKILGSSKHLDNRNVVKIIFTILHFVVVVVLLLLLQFQPQYLKNRTELRYKTLHTDRTP